MTRTNTGSPIYLFSLSNMLDLIRRTSVHSSSLLYFNDPHLVQLERYSDYPNQFYKHLFPVTEIGFPLCYPKFSLSKFYKRDFSPKLHKNKKVVKKENKNLFTEKQRWKGTSSRQWQLWKTDPKMQIQLGLPKS